MGPWWLSVKKLDGEVQVMRDSLEGLSDPRLAHMPALIKAWGALAEAEGALRKVSPEAVVGLGSAMQAIATAETAVREVRGLVTPRTSPRRTLAAPAASR